MVPSENGPDRTYRLPGTVPALAASAWRVGGKILPALLLVWCCMRPDFSQLVPQPLSPDNGGQRGQVPRGKRVEWRDDTARHQLRVIGYESGLLCEPLKRTLPLLVRWRFTGRPKGEEEYSLGRRPTRRSAGWTSPRKMCRGATEMPCDCCCEKGLRPYGARHRLRTRTWGLSASGGQHPRLYPAAAPQLERPHPRLPASAK